MHISNLSFRSAGIFYIGITMLRFSSNRSGSVLPVVLIFSVIAAIVVLSFVTGQYMFARPALKAPAELQALCNARSGIWKTIDNMSGNRSDTLTGINTLDSGFNKGVAGKSGDTNGVKNSIYDINSSEESNPYTSDSFGTCAVSSSYRGCFKLLRSRGSFRGSEKTVAVKLAGSVPFSGDTVYYLEAGAALQGSIYGHGRTGQWNIAVRADYINSIMAEILFCRTDSNILVPPLAIQYNAQLDSIKDSVAAPLFLDGSYFGLEWKGKRTIRVYGDVQITGKVNIQGIDFISSGSIKCLDDCRMRDVSLMAEGRIVISDRAEFSGSIISQTGIYIGGNSVISDRSILLSTGKASLKSKKDSLSTKREFRINLAGYSKIDAVIISFNDSIGIRVDRNAAVGGILWTKGYIGLEGTVSGTVYAKAIVDPVKVVEGKEQIEPLSVLPGTASLRINSGIRRYFFPFFMGKISIMQWQEL
jgi:hypothetical protein